jgi:hypothetical protein
MNYAEATQLIIDSRPVVTGVVWIFCGITGFLIERHTTYHGRHLL